MPIPETRSQHLIFHRQVTDQQSIMVDASGEMQGDIEGRGVMTPLMKTAPESSRAVEVMPATPG